MLHKLVFSVCESKHTFHKHCNGSMNAMSTRPLFWSDLIWWFKSPTHNS